MGNQHTDYDFVQLGRGLACDASSGTGAMKGILMILGAFALTGIITVVTVYVLINVMFSPNETEEIRRSH